MDPPFSSRLTLGSTASRSRTSPLICGMQCPLASNVAVVWWTPCLAVPAWKSDIKGALSIPVIIDYLRLCQATSAVTLQPQMKGNFKWRWTSNGDFTSRSAYQALFLAQSAVLGARELWKTKVPNNVVSSSGCAYTDASGRRRRSHGLQTNDDCYLCSQLPESLDHLLVQCSFSREIWFKTLRYLSLQRLTPLMEPAMVDWWLDSRKQLPKAKRKTFDSVVVLVVWRIWLHRNDLVFRHTNPNVSSLLALIRQDLDLWRPAKILSPDALPP